MKGLKELLTDPNSKLKKKNRVKVNHRIYCHAISKAFLLRKYAQDDDRKRKELDRFIKPIETNAQMTIKVYDPDPKILDFYEIKMTAIPAKHCPGSVMFLFEKQTDSATNFRILYTGDFRFEEDEYKHFTALHEVNGNPKLINELYLDTTFCSTDYETFPMRKSALNAIWRLVNGWIKKVIRKKRGLIDLYLLITMLQAYMLIRNYLKNFKLE